MAQATGTHSRYDLQTSGENAVQDVHDIIINIAPTETPFHTRFKKDKATNTYHEWLKDTLATAVNNNARIDGDEFSGATRVAPARLGNHCQISRKDIIVSRRADKVKKFGRTDELGYEIAKAGKELKRDCEMSALANQAAVVGDDSNASRTAGLPAWIRTNDSRGAGGADPTLSSSTYGYPNAAATDGTDRALSEITLLNTIRSAWTAGGNPSIIMVGPELKQRMSNYLFNSTRIATPYQDHGADRKKGASLMGAVDYYVTDFGTMEIIPNRFQREDDVFIIDPEHVGIAYLDGYHTEELAKTGDANKRMLITDWAVFVRAEDSCGIVADIDESAAMVA